MPSLFPGMDPYLEAHWRDVHARLIIYACDALQVVLPSALRARIEESVLIDAEPEPVTESYLEIIDRESGNRVVTVIEFLSPSNKSPGPNREQYLRKQSEVCLSNANLVEIDLNRYGTHALAFPLQHLKPQGRTAYMVCVRRAVLRGKAEVYPMPLWERLPVVKIPLRTNDADVPLDLQALVDQCYRNGAYDGTLNYAVDPDPPLFGADKEWADA